MSVLRCLGENFEFKMSPTSALLVSLILASTALTSTQGMKCRSDEDNNEDDSSFQEILQTCRNEERGSQQDQYGGRNSQQDQYGGRNSQQDSNEDSDQDAYRGQRQSESEHRNSRSRYEVSNHQNSGNRDGSRYEVNQQNSGNRDASRYEMNQQNSGSQEGGRNSQSERRNLNDRFTFNQNGNDQRRERSNNQSSQNSDNRFSAQNRMGGGEDGWRQSQDQDRDSSNNRDGDSDDLDQLDPCTVHCIFRHMQMLDHRGLPDKTAAIGVVTHGVRDRHVRRFLADTIDECHDLARVDAGRDRCRFAKNLALCYQQKGRRNCDDWDGPSPSATSAKYPYYKQY